MSASSTAAGSVILVSDASPIGSPTASTSTTSLTEVGRAPIRDSINSAKPGGTTGSPSHRQTPCCRTSRPSATSCSTMLRRYSTLPRVSSHSRTAAPGSKDPPRVADSSVSVSPRDSGCRSSRSNWPAFDTSCIAAGTGSPSRTVNTTLAPPPWTI